jgi:hypothetical protein
MKLMQVKVDGRDVSSNIIRQTTSQPFDYISPLDNSFAYPAPIAGGYNMFIAENSFIKNAVAEDSIDQTCTISNMQQAPPPPPG